MGVSSWLLLRQRSNPLALNQLLSGSRSMAYMPSRVRFQHCAKFYESELLYKRLSRMTIRQSHPHSKHFEG